jgi:hypothetical protein
MTDEAALMLRIGVFGVVSAVVYWFISYEALGTVALLTLGLGPGMAGLVMAAMNKGRSAGGRGEQLRRFLGLPREPRGEAIPPEDVVVIPGPTIWPFVLSLGFAIALTGLIFGLWLGLIGGILVVAGFWGWLTSVLREYRASRSAVEALRSREEMR